MKNALKIKAIVLFSGGLDSMLAVKVLQAQDIEVEALSFESNFFDAKKVEVAAKSLGIKFHKIDIRKEMLALVKNPPNGYGKNLNPCIDCHGMMFRLAGEYIKRKPHLSPLLPFGLAQGGRKEREQVGYFLASGEVLGQRPFSQNKQALLRVQKLSGQDILRPLSAKLLPETEMEKTGLVKRYKLLDIEGRGRERQMELAEKFGIKDYPSPAGGCLLTDPGFCERLGKMLDYWPDCTPQDAELLKYGRVFWLNLKDNKKALILVGRHASDNENLEKLAQAGDIVVKLKEEMGPSTLLRITNNKERRTNNELEIKVPEDITEINVNQEFENVDEMLSLTGSLTGYYATKLRGKNVKVRIETK